MATRDGSSTDALSILHRDHQTIEQLFRRFEQAHSAPERRRLATRIVRELSVHTAIEEELVYPALRRPVNGAADRVLVALEEHHLAKLALVEIERLDAADERFAAKVGVLAEAVRRHVREEERELFPRARRTLSTEELRRLGDELLRRRETAPTHPHPSAPDEPPGNALANVGAAALDRGREVLGRGVARMIDRSRGMVRRVFRRGEIVAREARQRIGRGLERAGREVRHRTPVKREFPAHRSAPAQR
jgi:hemerythrin-like domain-containing protein